LVLAAESPAGVKAGCEAKAKNSPEPAEERGLAVIRPARSEALFRMSEPLANLGGTAERPVFVPYGMKTGFFYGQNKSRKEE